MSCTNEEIQELLVPYLGHELDLATIKRVEGHLVSCEDCRSELSIIATLSEEAVPEPGKAFWMGLQVQVRDQVREQHEKSAPLVHRFLRTFAIPRLTWAATAAAVLITAVWFLFQPFPDNGSGTDDEILPPESGGGPVNVAELSPAQLDAAVMWAQNQFSRDSDAVTEDMLENPERDLQDDLSNLNEKELELLYEMLKQEEQGLRDKGRKRMPREKEIG